MTSKERVKRAITFEKPDRIPAAFEAVETVTKKLLTHYGFENYDQLIDQFNIDIIRVAPTYIGPVLKEYRNDKGQLVKRSCWGCESTVFETDVDTYSTVTHYPFEGIETLEEADAAKFPNLDWYDYDSIKKQCDRYPDKAIIMGHEGPFQQITSLMKMEEFFMLMIDSPEVAKRLLDRMVEFELEYYKRILEAGGGKIDILRPHDDYGTQISLLFSVPMWREFFQENTKKLVDLAHTYGAFYQQHSCGAIEALIPEFITCGVDVLEPIQKVAGLEPENLKQKYGGRITFHGGIDTQQLLPYGTTEQVEEEVNYFIKTLHQDGGYILMASQAFEGDVPIENIEAIYQAKRTID